MPQISRCPNCNKALQLPEGAAGRQVRCPACKHIFVFQAPAAERVTVARSSGGTATERRSAPPLPAYAREPEREVPSANLGDTPRPAATDTTGAACPSCKATLLPGAIACMDCGYLLRGERGAADRQGAVVLCPSSACGATSPVGEKSCRRCGTPLPASLGTLLHDRYRVERLLAQGGFGAVYLAADTREGNRPVAIKDMICIDPQEFTIRLNFFRREAEILRALTGLPVVPQVYDFIQQEQTALLVLEYIRGQDLLKVLEANDNKPFTLDRVAEWGQSICEILSHMHSQSPPLVHRDLKPANIMLMEDGRSIKLIDFGTARDLGRTQKDRQAAKTRVYTEGYAPPEQIVGKPEPRSDLFALAGTLYHLATGQAPEGFHTARELEGRLAAANGSIPAEERWFFEIIKINLAEDVNDRYFTAKEFRVDLERRQITREVTCPQCQASNRTHQPYCGKCAGPLTETTPPCNHCGRVNRMGSRCCIHCGNRLR